MADGAIPFDRILDPAQLASPTDSHWTTLRSAKRLPSSRPAARPSVLPTSSSVRRIGRKGRPRERRRVKALQALSDAEFGHHANVVTRRLDAAGVRRR